MRNGAWIRGTVANMLTLACHMSVMTLMPLYWLRRGLTDSEIGWLAAGFSVAAILARTWLGHWLEVWGRRPFLYLGCLLLTALPLSYPFVSMNLLPWFGLRLLQGAGYAFYITAVLTWVADRSPPDRIAQGQGVFGVSGLLGSAVGPMVAESVYRLYGFPTMFRVVGMAGLVAVALTASLPESGGSQGEARKASGKSLRWKDHQAMLWVTVPFGWLVGTVLTFLAPFADTVGLPSVGLYFAGFALASISVRLGSGGFIDRLPASRLVMLSGSLLGLSALALAMLGRYPLTALLFSAAILNGIGHGFLFPGLAAYTVRKALAWQRGGAIALFTGVFDSGALLGSIVSGYLCQRFGYPSAYVFAALLLLGSLPIFIALDDSRAPLPSEMLHDDPELLRDSLLN